MLIYHINWEEIHLIKIFLSLSLCAEVIDLMLHLGVSSVKGSTVDCCNGFICVFRWCHLKISNFIGHNVDFFSFRL